jgi:hypothetical protein
MGIGGGIEDDATGPKAISVQSIDEIAFVVALRDP